MLVVVQRSSNSLMSLVPFSIKVFKSGGDLEALTMSVTSLCEEEEAMDMTVSLESEGRLKNLW